MWNLKLWNSVCELESTVVKVIQGGFWRFKDRRLNHKRLLAEIRVCLLFVAPSTVPISDATINQQPIITGHCLVILHWFGVVKKKERKEKALIRSADDAKLNSLIHY